MRPVLIRWRDAHSIGGDDWTDAGELEDPECIVTTCGLLLRTTPRHHLIAQTVNPGEPSPHRTLFAIPLRNVVDMVWLAGAP